jgi:hypothetical protein
MWDSRMTPPPTLLKWLVVDADNDVACHHHNWHDYNTRPWGKVRWVDVHEAEHATHQLLQPKVKRLQREGHSTQPSAKRQPTLSRLYVA